MPSGRMAPSREKRGEKATNRAREMEPATKVAAMASVREMNSPAVAPRERGACRTEQARMEISRVAARVTRRGMARVEMTLKTRVPRKGSRENLKAPAARKIPNGVSSFPNTSLRRCQTLSTSCSGWRSPWSRCLCSGAMAVNSGGHCWKSCGAWPDFSVSPGLCQNGIRTRRCRRHSPLLHPAASPTSPTLFPVAMRAAGIITNSSITASMRWRPGRVKRGWHATSMRLPSSLSSYSKPNATT